MKLQTRLRQWWASQLAAAVRPDIVMTALQKAGEQGLILQELIVAYPGSSRSKVDRALRRLRQKGLVEKNGDRWAAMHPAVSLFRLFSGPVFEGGTETTWGDLPKPRSVSHCAASMRYRMIMVRYHEYLRRAAERIGRMSGRDTHPSGPAPLLWQKIP